MQFKKLKLLTVALLIFPFLFPAFQAHCQECSPEAAQQEASSLEKTIDDSQAAEKRWANTWGFIWSGATVVQLAAIPLMPEAGDRKDLAVGAVGSVLGLIPTWIYGPRIIREKQRLREAKSETDPCIRRNKFSTLLADDAQDKKFRRGGLSHAGNVFVNVALAGVLSGVFHRSSSAFLLGLTGIPLGIVMIETQPHISSDKKVELGANLFWRDEPSAKAKGPHAQIFAKYYF